MPEQDYEDQIVKMSESIIEENLKHFGIPPSDWGSCLVSIFFKLRGWAGMFHRMETHQDEAPAGVRVSLTEFCAVHTIIARSAIEYVAIQSGSWRGEGIVPLKTWLDQIPPQKGKLAHYGSISSFSRIAGDFDQDLDRRDVLQEQFEMKLLNAISASESLATDKVPTGPPEIQFITCIDDRECSFRRQLEQTKRTTGIHVETFGVAGFFGLPLIYKSFCQPVGEDLTPDRSASWKVEEVDDADHLGGIDRFKNRAKWAAQVTAMLEAASFSPLGSILVLILSPVFALRIFLMGYLPIVEHVLWSRLRQLAPVPVTDVKTDISPETAAAALAPTFTMTGLNNFFSPFVVVFGHGSSSVNNPYFAGYNCGACAGKKGGPSARMFARLANDVQVRAHLSKEYGIAIPGDTVFIAGEHDTAKDTVSYYDLGNLSLGTAERFETVRDIVSLALGKNALERCHRFFLADSKTPSQALHHVLQRATDYGEVRPELNHAGNAGVVVGRRCLTQTSFFDRRLFLTSYDPFGDDADGTLLEQVLVPSLKVCSGINLEYLFSTLAMDRHGAGTKSPLNIVGNIGMQQGTYGDLRSGLPVQMVDMHTPLRAFFVVDAPFTRVLQVLQRHPELEQLPYNDWIRLATRDPETGQIFRYIKGTFVPLPLQDVISRKHLTVRSEWNAFQPSHDRGMHVRRTERIVYMIASATAVLSFMIPFVLLDTSNMMNAHGTSIAACASALSLPVLAFSRRYMHGEHVFAQTAFLSCGLLLGFNYIAMAPTLEDLIEGWTMFGLTSAFLIGTYNDRVTVQSNALFAFASYRFADMALLVSVAFGGKAAVQDGQGHPGLVAAGVITAAMFKSSQFPLTSLFSRSMEGPTPTSALGYAGLSAHVGIVLLSSTVDTWMPFLTARFAIAVIGLVTAVHAGLLSQIHSDRKGALSYATSATIGLLYVIVACGYVGEALFLALGHSSLRMGQVLRAPNELLHNKRLVADLGARVWPKEVSDELYEFCWSLHRFDTDTNLIHMFDTITGHVEFLRAKTTPTKRKRVVFLLFGLAFAGLPFTPISVGLHELVIGLLPKEPLFT